MEQNRDVFAIPGSLHNEQAQGCHDLVRQGAMLVTSVHDVIQEIQVQCYDKAGVADISTSSASQGLLTYWGEDRMTVDQLIARSGLGLDDVIRELTELELMGFIHSTPGGYMRCIP
jgi:DNA processing protein